MKKNYNLNFILGTILAGFVVLLIIIGIFYTPYNPNTMDGTQKLKGISVTHFMGTDNFGRDVFSRVLKGAGTTFFIGICTVFIGTICGIFIGAFTGYYGGWIDEILMRISDAIIAFPSILLALIFISILGPGKYNVILALGIVFIPSFARIVRSEFLYHRNQDYVKSAKLMGVGDVRIMFIHILPNTFSVLISSIIIGFNNAVLAEASMSYLGIGVQPPEASLGRMLSESQGYLFTAPWCGIFPGIMIIVLVLGLSLLGDGIVAQTGGN